MAKKRRLRAKNRMGIVVPFDIAAQDVTLNNGMSLQEYIDSLPAQSGGSTVRIDDSGDYVDLIIEDNTPVISVSANALVMGGATKTATFKVSGRKLRGNISLNVAGGNFSLSKNSITPVDGTVAETTITVTYNGTATATASITISSAGATAKTVTAQYTEQQVPTISVEETPLSFKAAAGATQQKTLSVSGVNLEAAIAATIEGTNADKFTVSPASISQSDGSASGTLTITYTPGAGASGTHTATLKLTTTNGQTKSITLSGAVSTITVSKQSMTFSTDQGVAVTDTFTIEGANLNEDISIVASGTGFSVDKQTIAHSNGTVASTTVTVTFSTRAAGTNTGTITIQSSGVTKTISLSGTAAAATTSDELGRFTKEINGKTLYFGRISDGNGGFTNNVAVYNADYNTGAAASTKYSGAITIPASVACDGTTYNVTRIAGYAFGGCTALTSLTLPEGLTTIEVNAIRDCTNNSFTSIVIPDSVTLLDQNNLFGCSKLKSIVFGEGMTAVPKYCANGISGISSVIVGSNVTSFGQYSEFQMADNGVVTIKRTTPPSYVGVVFKTSSSAYPCNATLRVPASAVDTYKTAAGYGVNNGGGWKMFNPDNIVAIDE